MRIISLAEGNFTIDKSKLFVPFHPDEHDLQSRPTGSLLVEVQPFVVVTQKDVLLLDTGLGFMKEGRLQLHANLEAVGISPNQVTKVLMTHLHKDHAGGLTNEDKLSSRYQLNFPGATHYIHESELEFAFEKGFPSYIPAELEELRGSDKVVQLKGDSGFIDNYIEYRLTGAHSPFHQVFWIREQGETVFFGGDDAPQLQQMKHRFVAKYDHNGKLAAELRKQWWEEGREKKWKFLFYHDIRAAVWTEGNK